MSAGRSGLISKKIENAGWYTPDNLPDISSKATIARKLIDDYLACQSV